MTAPLVTPSRETLAEALFGLDFPEPKQAELIWAGLADDLLPKRIYFRKADALLASGVVRAADTLADDKARDAMRGALLAAMREWSEENYCAGWLIGLEHKLHREAGTWEILGRLVGWPIGHDAEAGWETWEEARARYASADYQIENYGRVIA